MSGFTAAIFDYGGVISSSPLTGMRAWCERCEIPWEAFRVLFAREQGAWSRFETSALTPEQFVAAFEAEASEEGLQVNGADFLTAFLSGMSIREDVVAAVRGLRAHLKTGCITNNVRATARGRNPLFDELFDAVVESAVVGMRKPDPRIYQLACEQLSVRPEDAIFLDDFGINLKAARALGMATIKVDETDSWRRSLLDLGIPEPWLSAAAV
ncbi:MAG: HAD family hydrolase [Dehalococcoidia bacterium]